MINKLLLLLKGQTALVLSAGRCEKNIWVFSSRNNTDFNYNSKYLFLYVKENLPQIKPLYVINDDEKRLELQKMYGKEYFIETKTLGGMLKALKGGVWCTSAGLPVYAVGVGKNRAVVNLWHGVPLKKIALLEEKVSPLTKLYFRNVFSKNYKAILTTSEKLVSVMAKSFDVDESIIKVWGQPRNDGLLDKEKQTAVLDDFADVPKYKKAVLYAPTYRENGTTKWFPFEDFELENFQRYLEENEILFCLRPHSEEKLDESVFSKNIIKFDASVLDDITEYLYLFDMLITDYSSIYIDYLLLDRPMVFLPYDKEEYLVGRGMNFEYDEVTPGRKPVTYREFIEVIENELENDSMKKSRDDVNDIFNQIKEPCSQNICNEILKIMEN